MNLNINKTFEEVCQDILNKRNTDYCGAYELMKHDKLKNECFKTDQKKDNKKKKLRSVNMILQRNRDLMEEEHKGSGNPRRSKKMFLSATHLKRLNNINNKFKDSSLINSTHNDER